MKGKFVFNNVKFYVTQIKISYKYLRENTGANSFLARRALRSLCFFALERGAGSPG